MGTSHEGEGYFLSHQPCPNCGSRDNLGTYSDGHSYCFGCHKYYSPTSIQKYSNYLRQFREDSYNSTPNQENSHLLEVKVTFPFDTEKNIPNQCYQWLKQYELTSQEIDNLDISWSESQGLLIFPIKKENNFIGYIGRRFKGEGSKYIIKGEKNNFDITFGIDSTLVFTEDLISAIKVGRVTATKPLFGTFLKSIPQGYDSYRLWLDKDKQISSIQQCRKWSQFGYDIKPIITELDPKEYNTQQIQAYLNL